MSLVSPITRPHMANLPHSLPVVQPGQKSTHNQRVNRAARIPLQQIAPPSPNIKTGKIRNKTLLIKDGSSVERGTFLAKGNFKKVYRGLLTKADGTTSPVAVSTPCEIERISTFAARLHKTAPRHFIAAQMVRVQPDQYVTISPLCSSQNTHYAGKKVKDAIYFLHPTSTRTPHKGRPDKNFLRLPFGMIQGTLEYYKALNHQGLYRGSHSDIKPENFVFNNTKKSHLAASYCTIKLIDLPETPEAMNLPHTHGYTCVDLNKHADDLFALRETLICSLYNAIGVTMFEGDTTSFKKMLSESQREMIQSQLDRLDTVFELKSSTSRFSDSDSSEESAEGAEFIPKSVANLGDKEWLINKEMHTLQTLFKQLPETPLRHVHTLTVLIGCINKLSAGIKKSDQTSFGKFSQLEAMKCMRRTRKILQKELGPSGPTGSPMKPLPAPATASSSKRKLSQKRLLPPTKKTS
ncbi:hypothetical protein COB21_02240 [Candidatus Aerophobetes bacterium]|uniref:Protein kinase domain-containing protein n=1 Tax=Aerophobetes bacterium TaxID=2030807 RepID=A0A2A4X5X1_UNCAE|nr:MAG: hypothetical protein COB21_02240 [Candidatus Aerophobetes bacterium]